MSWRIGVDIGGTFTDVAVVNEKDGTIGVTKVSSTPGNFGQAVLTAVSYTHLTLPTNREV